MFFFLLNFLCFIFTYQFYAMLSAPMNDDSSCCCVECAGWHRGCWGEDSWAGDREDQPPWPQRQPRGRAPAAQRQDQPGRANLAGVVVVDYNLSGFFFGVCCNILVFKFSLFNELWTTFGLIVIRSVHCEGGGGWESWKESGGGSGSEGGIG